MKKVLATLLVVVMALALLAGCGQKTTTTPTPAATPGTTTPADTPKATRDKTLTLRLGTNHSTGTAVALACQKFADLVNEKTGGGIKIEVYTDGVLGNETALRDACATGTVEIVALGAGVLGAYTGAANLPVSNYVWESEEQMMEVLLGELGKKYINDPVEQAAGIHVIYGWPQASRQLLTTKPVNSLADLRGMKIRVPAGNKLYVDTWDSYGAISQALSMNEVYTALEHGAIDGLEMPIDSLYTGGYHEVAKYLTLTNHMWYLQYIMINSNTWKSLSAEEQEILVEACKEAEKYHTELRDANIAEMVDKMKAAGVTVTEIDTTEWREATKAVNEMWMDTWGREVYDAFTNSKSGS